MFCSIERSTEKIDRTLEHLCQRAVDFIRVFACRKAVICLQCAT
ncbi:hypothetical protein NT05HA_1534 [Aggregatibacter aphrophilus NJ8700]|nr:hypothetical protein NT05HA_1534 [Aggregatibacter aphrophilus NJ8700]